MATAHEIRRLVGQRVALRLAAGAPGGPTATGRSAGVLDALDGTRAEPYLLPPNRTAPSSGGRFHVPAFR